MRQQFCDSKSFYFIVHSNSLFLFLPCVKLGGREALLSKYAVRNWYIRRGNTAACIIGLPPFYLLDKTQGVCQSRGEGKTEIYRNFLLHFDGGTIFYEPRQLFFQNLSNL